MKEQSKLENSELEIKNAMCPRSTWKVFLKKIVALKPDYLFSTGDNFAHDVLFES